MSNIPSKHDLDALLAQSRQLAQRAVGKMVEAAAESGDALPYVGLRVDQSPFWDYLKRNLIAVDDSPLWKAAHDAAAIALFTPRRETVLIHGESGVGKETFARMFAQTGPNAKFVALNCTGLPDYLVESELFGHLAGAFTGAIRDKTGLLIAAGDGVLFLDEIGDMPLSLQPKLLRAIQERRIRPVGSNTEHEIKCRIVCASHQNLTDARRFRQDLYWRISTHEIWIPPLRERLRDAALYINAKAPDCGIDTADYPIELPGNYRTLQAICARARLRKRIKDSGTSRA